MKSLRRKENLLFKTNKFCYEGSGSGLPSRNRIRTKFSRSATLPTEWFSGCLTWSLSRSDWWRLWLSMDCFRDSSQENRWLTTLTDWLTDWLFTESSELRLRPIAITKESCSLSNLWIEYTSNLYSEFNCRLRKVSGSCYCFQCGSGSSLKNFVK